MSSETISPRGVPPIRTDWLAHVAQRLAGVGLAELRALSEEQRGHLSDDVDGESWTFDLMKFSGIDATAIEFDADLWAPADAGGRPSLRAGFALAPRWDPDLGRTTLVRVEIGPRAAVTFDPENWMLSIPQGASVPPPIGVTAGTWSFDGGVPDVALGEPPSGGPGDAFARLRVDLTDLRPVIAGEPVPELVLGGYEVQAAKGVLGRLRGRRGPAAPVAVLSLQADGPLDVAWTGADPIDSAIEAGLVLDQEAPVLADDQLVLRASAGTITITGVSLRAGLVTG